MPGALDTPTPASRDVSVTNLWPRRGETEAETKTELRQRGAPATDTEKRNRIAMATFKARIESGFAAFARTVYRHRIKTLLIVFVALAALVSQLRYITYDTSTESFFRKDDPALIEYNRFRELFGRDEFLIAAVNPPKVFDKAFLAKLRDFTHALQTQVPHLKDVTSLINVRDTRGEGDRLVVEDLVKDIPQTPQAMAALKQRVLSSHLYPNLFISEDGRFTTVLIETQAFSDEGAKADVSAGFGDISLAPGTGTPAVAAKRKPLTDKENSQIVRAVERVVAQYNGPDFPIHLTGSPVVTDFLKRAMQSNMARFMALAVLAIGVFLGVLFRRISGVALPLLVVVLSVVATVGAMATLGVAFKLPLMILPSFLLAVGVGAVVHLLAMFYRNYERGGDKRQALVDALAHSGLPIVMTSLTTAAGLLSFITATLASVADLGVYAALGVMISLVLTLVLVPALLALLPIRRHPRFSSQEGSPLADRFLMGLGNFATRRARLVVVVSVLVSALAMTGLPWLRFSHNTLKWFPKSSDIRQATDLIDHELKGSISVEMMIDTGHENGLYDPAVLNRIQALERYAEDYTNAQGQRFVGKTNSVVDVVKEINRALHENQEAYYTLPQDRDLIAQELLLFENSGSDDLQRLVDSQFRIARVTIKSPWDDAAAYVHYVSDLQAKGSELFGNSTQVSAHVTVTGLIRLFTESVFALMRSMVESYTAAIIVITILMILLIGRLRLGLLSMVPNLLPIGITLGFMGWMNIPLDAFTLLIGSIALGLAVDDTIHFFHHFLRYYEETGDAAYAVHETLLTSGRAMLFTTMVLVVGFWLFMFATLNNLFYFGLLTGLTLVVALAADMLLSPAILVLTARKAPATAAPPAPATIE